MKSKKILALALASAMTVTGIVAGLPNGQIFADDGTATEVTLPTPVYFNNFENGAGDATIVGSGAMETVEDAGFGKVFHNDATGTNAVRTNYLQLPDDTMAKVGEAGNKEMTVGFWVNKADEDDAMFHPLFSAYGDLPDLLEPPTAEPGNGWPMFILQTRGLAQINCAGWCDFNAANNDALANAESAEWLTNDTDWHYYTAVFTETTLKVYADNVLLNAWTVDNSDGQQMNGIFSAAASLDIMCLGGNQAWTSADADPSYMFDDVAIYSSALTQAQIAKIMDDKVPVADDSYTADIVVNDYDNAKIIGHYTFDDTLANDASSSSASTIGNAFGTATSATATYAEGVYGNALSLAGAKTDGVVLDVAPTSDHYTISFDAKTSNVNQGVSPMVFIGAQDQTTQDWVVVKTGSWATDGVNGPMAWGRDAAADKWFDLPNANNSTISSIKNDEWFNVTYVQDGATGTIYVNGVKTYTGTMNECVTANTKIFLGLNAWDPTFSGLIDNLYVIDESVAADEVAELAAGGTVEFTIPELGVTISGLAGALPNLTKVKVVKAGTESENTAKGLINTAVSKDNNSVNKLEYFTFEFTNDDMPGEVLEPDSTLTIKFQVPAGFDATKVAIFHVTETGATQMKTTVVDGIATAEVDSFSGYALAELAAAVPEETTTEKVTEKAEEETTTLATTETTTVADTATTVTDETASKTGDVSTTMSVMLLIGAAMVLVLGFKKDTVEE